MSTKLKTLTSYPLGRGPAES